jgi:hypothetical protein
VVHRTAGSNCRTEDTQNRRVLMLCPFQLPSWQRAGWRRTCRENVGEVARDRVVSLELNALHVRFPGPQPCHASASGIMRCGTMSLNPHGPPQSQTISNKRRDIGHCSASLSPSQQTAVSGYPTLGQYTVMPTLTRGFWHDTNTSPSLPSGADKRPRGTWFARHGGRSDTEAN